MEAIVVRKDRFILVPTTKIDIRNEMTYDGYIVWLVIDATEVKNSLILHFILVKKQE